jgi:murein L,D-transpeptidase YcbB/YkuD
MQAWRTAITLALAAGLSGACRQTVDPAEFAQALSPALERQAAAVPDRTVTAAARAFYEQRSQQAAWTDSNAVDEAVAVLRSASAHGLSVAADESTLAEAFAAVKKRQSAAAAEWARFDVRVTFALLRVGRDVALGRTRPETIGALWKPRVTASELAASLAAAGADGSLTKWLDTIAPAHDGYQRLRTALETLERAEPRDEQKLEIVRLNLDRWRWLPSDLGSRRLIANVPEFVLRAEEERRTAFEMRVVVGKPPDHQTPLFSDAMETVVFNPYWHIPKSIIQAETVPAIAKDPRYLERNAIEVLDASAGHALVDPEDVDWEDEDAVKSLVFRQRPGEDNALGSVKFLFPNRFAVYMHDTPSTAGFQQPVRALSHGCVRVAEPEKLAAFVLGDQPAWTPALIAASMTGQQERYVKLTRPIPVHLVYFTALVDAAGGLRFFSDIYKLDEKQLRSIRRQPL